MLVRYIVVNNQFSFNVFYFLHLEENAVNICVETSHFHFVNV